MNGSYLTADTPKARLAVVFKSAMELYYSLHPSHRYLGFFPDYSFIENYIGIFVDREIDNGAQKALEASIAGTSEPVEATIRELKRRNAERDKEIAQQLNLRSDEAHPS